MTKENYSSKISVHCGKTTDGIKKLKALCEEEAAKLATTIDIPSQSTVSVPFWTSDHSELICVGKFKKNEEGTVVYELDFSESTL